MQQHCFNPSYSNPAAFNFELYLQATCITYYAPLYHNHQLCTFHLMIYVSEQYEHSQLSFIPLTHFCWLFLAQCAVVKNILLALVWNILNRNLLFVNANCNLNHINKHEKHPIFVYLLHKSHWWYTRLWTFHLIWISFATFLFDSLLFASCCWAVHCVTLLTEANAVYFKRSAEFI